jgi:hypothetical protein
VAIIDAHGGHQHWNTRADLSNIFIRRLSPFAVIARKTDDGSTPMIRFGFSGSLAERCAARPIADGSIR